MIMGPKYERNFYFLRKKNLIIMTIYKAQNSHFIHSYVYYWNFIFFHSLKQEFIMTPCLFVFRFKFNSIFNEYNTHTERGRKKMFPFFDSSSLFYMLHNDDEWLSWGWCDVNPMVAVHDTLNSRE